MQCYYLECECSLCFVKRYSIPLVLISQICPAFFLIVKKMTQLRHACRSVQHEYDTSNKVFVFLSL